MELWIGNGWIRRSHLSFKAKKKVEFLYKRLTRVKVILTVPKTCVPIHRDKVVNTNYDVIPYQVQIKGLAGHDFHERNREWAIKIPLSERPHQYAGGLVNDRDRLYQYDPEGNFFAIKEVTISHGTQPVDYYRGVIFLDGILDPDALESQSSPMPLAFKESSVFCFLSRYSAANSSDPPFENWYLQKDEKGVVAALREIREKYPGYIERQVLGSTPLGRTYLDVWRCEEDYVQYVRSNSTLLKEFMALREAYEREFGRSFQMDFRVLPQSELQAFIDLESRHFSHRRVD